MQLIPAPVVGCGRVQFPAPEFQLPGASLDGETDGCLYTRPVVGYGEPTMSSDTPTDERGTDAEITTFQIHSEPSGDGRVAVEVKPPDLVTLAITSSDHGTLPGGTQSHAILTVEQAESLVEELEEAVANTDADRHPPE